VSGADDRTTNGSAEWFNHDNDPEEQRIWLWLELQNVSCGNLGGHTHRNSMPPGMEMERHHHHDQKCIFQAGINSVAPLVASQRRQIESINDAMDQIHRIAAQNGSVKGQEYCRDRRY
jgi:hypothetical protein